jgi:hypothetical protein
MVHPRLVDRRTARTFRLGAALALAAVLANAAAGEDASGPNLYEWLAVAPVVVVAAEVESAGKYTHFHVEHVLRGDAPVGAEIRVMVRRANRDRDRGAHREPLRVEDGERYVLLLSPAPAKADAPPAYELARGVSGTLRLPAEGEPALLAAIERFIRIQDLRDERVTWREMTAMLEETDLRYVSVALEQFLKFQRGGPDLVGTLRPLLDHPDDDLRANTARLLGQIANRGAERLADPLALRNELASRARRDEAVGVRIEATLALGCLDWESVRAIIEEIAREDPDQTVRYAAEKLLWERARAGKDAAISAEPAGPDGT